MRSRQAIIIGASAGGISAVQKFLQAFKLKLSPPVVVVQHLRADSEVDLGLVFGKYTSFSLSEARDKVTLEKNHIYFAPGGYHLLIEKDFSFSLSQDDPVHFSRPSIDVCFETGAQAYGPGLCGILLTGANNDGAMGLKFIQEHGGYTMVQDPAEAEVSVMPKSALAIMTPDFVGSLNAMAEKLIVLQNNGRTDVQ